MAYHPQNALIVSIIVSQFFCPPEWAAHQRIATQQMATTLSNDRQLAAVLQNPIATSEDVFMPYPRGEHYVVS